VARAPRRRASIGFKAGIGRARLSSSVRSSLVNITGVALNHDASFTDRVLASNQRRPSAPRSKTRVKTLVTMF
jgi:hypothetical protein